MNDEDEEFNRIEREASMRKEAVRATVAQQEPIKWMEMVVANLVREGVNKHRARELAQHFYTSPPARKPLTRDQVKGMLTDAGYDAANLQARWDFRNGVRQCEAAHGIKE